MSEGLTALKYDALGRELERMRRMEAGCFGKFFSWIILTGFTFVVLYLVPYPAVKELLPFWVVTAGVQASFYLHLVDFARVQAAALAEGKKTHSFPSSPPRDASSSSRDPS